MLLANLPNSYNSLINALEGRPEEDFLNLVKGKLNDKYRKRVNNVDTIEVIQDRALKIRNRKHMRTSQNMLECYFCKKKRHVKRECRKYKAWKNKNEKVNKVTDNNLCFNTNTRVHMKDSWFIDSGATSHMTNNRDFFNKDFINITDKVTVANGKKPELKVSDQVPLNVLLEETKD